MHFVSNKWTLQRELKKVHYRIRRGSWEAFESTECRCQLAYLHCSHRREVLSFTCRLFVACVASVSAQVSRESWDESNFQFSTNLCGIACYAGYKQSYVLHETKPLSLPVLHLNAYITARLWTHGLWPNRIEERMRYLSVYSPSLSLLRLRQ